MCQFLLQAIKIPPPPKKKEKKNAIWYLFTQTKSVMTMPLMMFMSVAMITVMKAAGNVTVVIKMLMKKIRVMIAAAVMMTVKMTVNVFM